MLEAEEVALASPHPASVARFAGIYGPGRTQLLDAVRDGGARWDPDHPHWTNRIHRDDGAAAIHRLLELGADAPARLLVVDDEPATRETVITWLAERLGVARPAPRPGQAGGRGGGAGKRCSNRRLRALGIDLRYPTFRAGYDAMIDELHGA
jgi:nucleoside-diphosphate-sugar epimerase